MIHDDLKRLVGETFPDAFDEPGDNAEFHQAIFDALEAGKTLTFLGRDLGCEAWEIAALKKIEEAHQTGIIPESL
jgi:hypothetical protein